MLGFFDAIKKSRRQVSRENQSQGRAGEKKIREKYEMTGYKVTRTGKGHDLKAEKKDWFTGENRAKYIEVKTGNSKLSKLQKKKQGQIGGKYVVERLKPTTFGLVSNNRESDSRSKKSKSSGFGSPVTWGSGSTKKKKSGGIFGSSTVDSIFGSSSKKKSKSKSVSMFGSSTVDSIFGSSSKKKSKSKSVSMFGSSTVDSIFGSSSKKKSKSKSVSMFGSSTVDSIFGSSSKKKSKSKKSVSMFGSSTVDSIFGSGSKKKSRKKKSVSMFGSGSVDSIFGSSSKKKSRKKKSVSMFGSSKRNKKDVGIW